MFCLCQTESSKHKHSKNKYLFICFVFRWMSSTNWTLLFCFGCNDHILYQQVFDKEDIWYLVQVSSYENWADCVLQVGRLVLNMKNPLFFFFFRSIKNLKVKILVTLTSRLLFKLSENLVNRINQLRWKWGFSNWNHTCIY